MSVLPSEDDLGDRMKFYERLMERRFGPSCPIYARIDGRGFSQFTRGMVKPFDERLTNIMIKTAQILVERTHARLAYTQSDEISVVFIAAPSGELMFGGKMQKLCGILSGLTTAIFIDLMRQDESLRPWWDKFPHFDCRVVQLPSLEEVSNMILWREQDATRNSVSMCAQAKFSHGRLQGVDQPGMLALLDGIGFDYDGLDEKHRRGSYLKRVTRQRTLTEEERLKIREDKRPPEGELFYRSTVEVASLPQLMDLTYRERTKALFPELFVDLPEGVDGYKTSRWS